MQKINKKFFILLCRHLTIKGQEDAQNVEDSVRTQRIQIDLDVLTRNDSYPEREEG